MLVWYSTVTIYVAIKGTLDRREKKKGINSERSEWGMGLPQLLAKKLLPRAAQHGLQPMDRCQVEHPEHLSASMVVS